jgi:hypothetical protein
MLDRCQGLDLDHCLLVMRTLAKFHAASVVLHQQDPDSMKEYDLNFFSEPSIEDKLKRLFRGKALTTKRSFRYEIISLFIQEYSLFLQIM